MDGGDAHAVEQSYGDRLHVLLRGGCFVFCFFWQKGNTVFPQHISTVLLCCLRDHSICFKPTEYFHNGKGGSLNMQVKCYRLLRYL